MLDKTRTRQEGAYKALIEEYVDGAPTARKLARALKAKAEAGCKKSTWNTLKSICVRMQREAGYPAEADKLKQIASWPNDIQNTKRPFAKKISQSDVRKLLKAASEKLSTGTKGQKAVKGDKALITAIHLLNLTGMRIDELQNCRFDGNVLKVVGGKKSEKLQRGADRDLRLNISEGDIRALSEGLELIREIGTPALKQRFNRLSEATFPKRNCPPCTKTFRHQKGSDLKAAIKRGDISKAKAAYFLGHQSADSMNKYGDSRSGGGGLDPRISVDSDASNVRDPSAEMESEMTPSDRMSDNPWATTRQRVADSNPTQPLTKQRAADSSPSFDM